MSRDEQIEEMANAILYQGHYDTCCKDDCETIASLIYNKGYRKSTDLAEEIFAENHNMLLKILKATDDGLGEAIRKDDEKAKDVYTGAKETIKCVMLCLAELEKKYTKGGKEQDG